ncbi:MAG TPA: DNA-binding protein [Bacteroidetes bacterium]|nr:HU family DNA-binding protein [Ignavibacteriaceae bacterium]HAY33731.1 DNA-binding protein [Bacteroidota bacterium]HRI45467.1 HU family DNA-binding protein [Ignavibacteriaceae bacterium]
MAVAKPLTKAQILDHLSKKTGTTKKLAGQFMEEFITLAYKEAKKSFVIPGLGKLVVSSRKKRKGRNPQTGAEIVIPARKVLKFRIAKQAKDTVLGPAKK